ncbi:hypothetical protein Q31b_39480 [Novipirellula aureliae]|uniref:Uncharacterized protein n=1 Tax=Novipirellula aureliae TaxID=2527966 RepID=A0A5C6DPW6_9BACT|nr:hypothetical protein [Novipirellula aureliae]TWU38870.1 hypothetical protein Q31b_39480 [Novipirellula aureliae]
MKNFTAVCALLLSFVLVGCSDTPAPPTQTESVQEVAVPQTAAQQANLDAAQEAAEAN